MALLVAGGVQYAGDHPPKRRAASTTLLPRASRILGETEIGRRPTGRGDNKSKRQPKHVEQS